MEKFEYFKSTRLKESACIGCGATVRVGYSNGWRVTLNPDPITIEQEIEELKAKRLTYELYSTVLGDEPIYRSVMQIAANKNRKVLATHKCERKQK
jgi:hypothetical protein